MNASHRSDTPPTSDTPATSGMPADSDDPNELRRRLVPKALVVGLLVGLTATVFRYCLETGESWRTALLDAARPYGVLGFVGAVLACVACLIVAVLLVRRLSPEAAGSGIPFVKRAVAGEKQMPVLPLLWVKFVGGVLGIGAGLGLGREGPTIQMGAALAEGLDRIRPEPDRRNEGALLVCGSAAGLAAAFNAPLAGIVFALEELRIRSTNAVFYGAATACLAADAVTRLLVGDRPVFTVEFVHVPTVACLPHCFVIGVLGGLLGIAFNQAILVAGRFSKDRPDRTIALAILAAALLVVGVGWFAPTAIGGGLSWIDGLLKGAFSLQTLAALLVFRFVLTSGSYALGTPGGIFAPMLLLGGILGAGCGLIADGIGGGGHYSPEPEVWAVAGMAAMFGAVIRCPLTGVVLLIEMTGHYAFGLPLLCAAFVGSATGDFFRVVPVYEALIEEDREREAEARRQDRFTDLGTGGRLP